jgi:hypothetical protein
MKRRILMEMGLSRKVKRIRKSREDLVTKKTHGSVNRNMLKTRDKKGKTK